MPQRWLIISTLYVDWIKLLNFEHDNNDFKLVIYNFGLNWEYDWFKRMLLNEQTHIVKVIIRVLRRGKTKRVISEL